MVAGCLVDGQGSKVPKVWPKVINFFSCSTQLNMKFSLLINNMKMPTIVGIFISISREIFMLSYV